MKAYRYYNAEFLQLRKEEPIPFRIKLSSGGFKTAINFHRRFRRCAKKHGLQIARSQIIKLFDSLQRHQKPIQTPKKQIEPINPIITNAIPVLKKRFNLFSFIKKLFLNVFKISK